MMIIGLTGSIGMGKSTAARRFAELGVPVFDADAEVHRLYEGPGVAAVEAAFPGTSVHGRIDRKRLAAVVMDDPAAMKKLESIVHPLVREAERAFLQEHAGKGTPAVVLEIPLLFETGADQLVDATVIVSAPLEVQAERVLARPGMTRAKLDALLAQQIPDKQKRARADYLIDSSGPIADTHKQIDAIVEAIDKRTGTALQYWLEDSSLR